MYGKKKFYKTVFLVPLFLLFLCINFTQPLYAANVLGRPRKMFLIKTEHFDIIYSNLSEESALLLVQNADSLYEKAAAALNSESNLHMPVIISPDSDVLSVEYTPKPYNRIIIFDSPADYSTAVFDDTMLGLFYREIYRALLQSIRDPFNQTVAKWGTGEIYQPVALFNMPYSFIEGAAYIAESEADGEGRLNDGYFLQILSQAKLEGKFPKWMQVTAVRDTYPGTELALAAGAGFSAFLIDAYGVEKYAELWQESGKLNPLLTQGVFKNAYGKKLAELWNEFEESVPLPENLADIEGYGAEGELVFPKDKDANYEHILITDYGTVWYDRIRHEVDIYDKNNILKIRQLLFLANNVERLALSPDGRYMAVSSTQARNMEGLSASSVWIYDLRERKFLDPKYELRDAAIVKTAQGGYAVAGVNVKDVRAKLEVYTLPLGDNRGEQVTLLYRHQFERNETPFSPVYAGDGFISYILNKGNEQFLCKACFDGSPARNWKIETGTEDDGDGSSLKIQRLSYAPSRSSSLPFYTFVFTQPQEHSFTRAGFLYLTAGFEPERVVLTAADLSGGVNFPAVSAHGTLFYSAHKFSQNQLRSVALSSVPRVDGKLRELDKSVARGESGELNQSGELENAPSHGQLGELPQAQSLSDYKIRRYNPFMYMTDLSFTPLFPLKLLDLSEGNLYWPGLGLTIESQTDPCMNTKAMISAGWTYLPMDFSWTKDMPSPYFARLRSESLNLKKDKSVAVYFENSSTPVYIRAGSIFNFNLKGEYNFKIVAGGQFKIPIGIALRNMLFDLQASYQVSTDYYDQTQSEIRPSLENWPAFQDAYEMYEISARIEYSNIHQYGYSAFEQRGLKLGMRAYTMWDMCEVKILQQAREQREAEEENYQLHNSSQNSASGQAGQTNEETLTNAQRQNLLTESLADITQMNAGFYATIAIPRLNLFTMHNGFVFSMPALISAEFVNKPGTALEAGAQLLLIGHEYHNTLIPSFLYSRRAGLWAGYNMSLLYDTAETRLPDIRHENYLAEVFHDVTYSQEIYVILNWDFNVTLGKLSSIPINSTLRASFYPESHGYNIKLDLSFFL